MKRFIFCVLVLLVIFAQVGCDENPVGPVKVEPLAVQDKIVGFHIDMNINQFKDPYLRDQLKELAQLGYNTILWEVENNIQWDTCPECVSPEAFSKEGFKKLLAYSRDLGLEPIPLLQTIGHCEYVLKHDKYKHLAEVNYRIDQYCPRNPEVIEFLNKWIAEYIEVFGDIKQFHLGADEARALGLCDQCKAYIEKYSLSALYIDHVNAVTKPVIERGITPIIWADMILHHPEAINKLSRDIMIFDWNYDAYQGRNDVRIWGEIELLTKDQIDPVVISRFWQYLFPYSSEPGREPDAFYTADYLVDEGFDTVFCPTSSSWGDNVFAPRNYHHMRNTFGSFHKGLDKNLHGAMLTSWTVRLVPWELQKTCIELPQYLVKNPKNSLDDYEQFFVEKHFNISDRSFFKASGLLSKDCLFTRCATLGFHKRALPTPPGHIESQLDITAEKKGLDVELENCRLRLAEYKQSLELFNAYSNKAAKGHELLELWKLAARNLINRAETSICIIENRMGLKVKNAEDILKRMRQLKKETRAMYDLTTKPTRRDEIIDWIYLACEHAMEKIAAKDK